MLWKKILRGSREGRKKREFGSWSSLRARATVHAAPLIAIECLRIKQSQDFKLKIQVSGSGKFVKFYRRMKMEASVKRNKKIPPQNYCQCIIREGSARRRDNIYKYLESELNYSSNRRKELHHRKRIIHE